MNILKMTRSDLLALNPEDVKRELSPEEIVHIAKMLGAFWTYDYEAAAAGRIGLHAELKSGLHSDGFFVSRILLEPENICRIIAWQLVLKIRSRLKGSTPDYIVGIPDGATKLGKVVAEIMGSQLAEMQKVEGKITMVTVIEPGKTLLLIEDFCTRGTGFIESVLAIKASQTSVGIFQFDPVIINRGGQQVITVDCVGKFDVLPVVEWRVQDWDPKVHCDLCDKGSEVIKPKATDENWLRITTSQQ